MQDLHDTIGHIALVHGHLDGHLATIPQRDRSGTAPQVVHIVEQKAVGLAVDIGGTQNDRVLELFAHRHLAQILGPEELGCSEVDLLRLRRRVQRREVDELGHTLLLAGARDIPGAEHVDVVEAEVAGFVVGAYAVDDDV